ncbi:hypothetical protein TSAR_002822 [Trichomalopsis sarcophagae]|uniref:Ionotropic glutamate receptor L-glutamate and glycine-binding domain-containing protein n=1 Tax=Trichomalopsis sarcophagae TaxID=543379 RepID=A0A232FGK3_9HYME|nr:hypothetical protein TSAR_002822 [Trichomalopsis sarcophagae]
MVMAYVDLVKAMGWKSFTIIYENNEGLVRLQELLKAHGPTEHPITIKQLVLDCSIDKIYTVLKQAQEIGMMTDYHSYFITSLDLHAVDLSEFKHGGTNITAFRIVNPEKTQNVVQDWIFGEQRYLRKLNMEQNEVIGSGDFNPVVRLSNNEFYGLCLPLASWLQFRELFDEIDRYFQAYSEDDMLDQRITFSGFYIRFMISYSDRAFELLEDDETTIRKDSGESRSKKVRKPSLVFKRVTFDRLKALSKIIDHRIKYLLKVKEAITIIVKELGDYSKDKLVNSENAQFTYFTSYNVERATRDFDETLTETALMYDAVHLFARALHVLDASQQIDIKPLSCDLTNTWDHGYSLINYMKNVEMTGLTGSIKFDNQGFRSDFILDIIELNTKDGLQKIGRWNSTRGINFTRSYGEIYTQIVDNLHNKTFIVTTILSAPYCMYKESSKTLSGNSQFEGYSIDLIQEISRILGFNYTIQIVPDGRYGSFNRKTKEWDGMIKELLDQKADLAIADLTITSHPHACSTEAQNNDSMLSLHGSRSGQHVPNACLSLIASAQENLDFSSPRCLFNYRVYPPEGEEKKYSVLKLPHIPRGLRVILHDALEHFPLSLDVWIYMATAYLGVSVLLFILARQASCGSTLLPSCQASGFPRRRSTLGTRLRTIFSLPKPGFHISETRTEAAADYGEASSASSLAAAYFFAILRFLIFFLLFFYFLTFFLNIQKFLNLFRNREFNFHKLRE